MRLEFGAKGKIIIAEFNVMTCVVTYTASTNGNGAVASYPLGSRKEVEISTRFHSLKIMY